MTRQEREEVIRYGRACLTFADELSKGHPKRATAQALVGIGALLAVLVDIQDGGE